VCFAWVALGLLILAINVTPITNNDIFLHLKTGELILETGQVPVVDDYSALARGRPFVAHEWLAGVLFAIVEKAGGSRGFDLLILFKCAVALAIGATLYRAARAEGALPAVALPCLAFVMILAAARMQERPHIFSFLLLAVYMLVLARRRSGGPRRKEIFYLLPILQVLWANLHGSFLLGPTIVGLAAAGEVIDAWIVKRAEAASSADHLREAGRLAALAAGLVPCCLLNPYGLKLLAFPFELTGSAFMEQIFEWQPPFSSSFRLTYMARYYVVWCVLGIAAFIASLTRESRPRTFLVLTFAAFLALSLRMNRNVTDFAFATLPGTSAALTLCLTRGARAAARPDAKNAAAGTPLHLIAWALLGLAGWFAFFGYGYGPSFGRRELGLGLGPNVPVGAADELARRGVVGTSFNTYGAGAYLVYRFYPRVRVGMDSRNDVYGERLYAEYQEATQKPDALKAMLRRLQASFIFLEWPQPGMAKTARAIRATDEGWRPVYFDDAAVVYLEEDGPYAEQAKEGYALLDPLLFLPGTWSREKAHQALSEADRAIAQSGRSCIARVMRVEALLALGRTDAALAEEARLVAEDPPLAHISILLGLAHLARGDRTTAAARLRRALELNPFSDVAREALKKATATP